MIMVPVSDSGEGDNLVEQGDIQVGRALVLNGHRSGFPGRTATYLNHRCHRAASGQQRQIGCSALHSSQVFNPAIISPLVRGSR